MSHSSWTPSTIAPQTRAMRVDFALARPVPSRFGPAARPLMLLLGLLAVLTVLLFLVSPAPATAAIERSYDLQPHGRFELHSRSGDVRVIGTDRPGVRFVLEARNDKIESEIKIEEQQEPGLVSLRVERKGHEGRHWLNFSRGDDYEIRVEVPRQTALLLQTSGGSVEVETVDGDAELRTSGGSIHGATIGGDVRARTSGGSIEIDDVDGSVDAETSGGSIELTKVARDVVAETSGGHVRIREAGGRVEARTSGGSAKVDFARGVSAGGRVSSSGGGVSVTVDAAAKLEVDASSSGGSVRCDLPVEVQGKVSRGSLRGQLNGGGNLLVLRSSGGGIDIGGR
jgi:DUF4097 and DUF4098 domain-containing protein YvlB